MNYFLPVWSIFSFLLVTTSILSSSGSNWTNSGEQKMSGRLPKSGNSVLDHPLRQLRSGEWWPWTNVNKIILLHFWLLSPLCVRSVSGPTFGKLSYFKPHLCSALYLSVAMVNHSINAPLVMSFFFLLRLDYTTSDQLFWIWKLWDSHLWLSQLRYHITEVKTPLEVGGDQNRVDEMVKTDTDQMLAMPCVCWMCKLATVC